MCLVPGCNLNTRTRAQIQGLSRLRPGVLQGWEADHIRTPSPVLVFSALGPSLSECLLSYLMLWRGKMTIMLTLWVDQSLLRPEIFSEAPLSWTILEPYSNVVFGLNEMSWDTLFTWGSFSHVCPLSHLLLHSMFYPFSNTLSQRRCQLHQVAQIWQAVGPFWSRLKLCLTWGQLLVSTHRSHPCSTCNSITSSFAL